MSSLPQFEYLNATTKDEAISAIGPKFTDAAVFAGYGWPSNLSDEEILERLLALNLERGRSRL